MHAGAGNRELDRVGAPVGVGVDERLPEAPGAAIVGVDDGECRRVNETRRQPRCRKQQDARTHDHPPPGDCWRSWRGNLPRFARSCKSGGHVSPPARVALYRRSRGLRLRHQ